MDYLCTCGLSTREAGTRSCWIQGQDGQYDEILPQNGPRNPQAEQIMVGSFRSQECWTGITWEKSLWMPGGLFRNALAEAVCTGDTGSTTPWAVFLSESERRGGSSCVLAFISPLTEDTG